MKQVITKQGKTFNYGEILLFNKSNDNIIVLLNDEAQMKKYFKSGDANDAPFASIPYSDDALSEIVDSMKQIAEYSESRFNDIKVKYEDGTSVNFNVSNRSIIENNLIEQRKNKVKKNKIFENASIQPTKINNSRTTQRRVMASFGAVIASLSIYNSIHKFNKGTGNISDNDTIDYHKAKETIETSVNYNSAYIEDAKKLYQEILDKNPNRGKDLSGINWNLDLALAIVEFMNGEELSSIAYMSDNYKNRELENICWAIQCLIQGNILGCTTNENTIDLASYIRDERDKTFVNNAMVISRRLVQEKEKYDFDGNIMDESAWSTIDKFSTEYENMTDEVLNYEFKTLADDGFLDSSVQCRYIVSRIFETINLFYIPYDGYFETQLQDEEKQEICLLYYYDEYNGITYLPEFTKTGFRKYVAYDIDENGEKKKLDIDSYTPEDMLYISGNNPFEDRDDLRINKYIVQNGFAWDVKNYSQETQRELTDRYIYSLELKNTNSMSK